MRIQKSMLTATALLADTAGARRVAAAFVARLGPTGNLIGRRAVPSALRTLATKANSVTLDDLDLPDLDSVAPPPPAAENGAAEAVDPRLIALEVSF